MNNKDFLRELGEKREQTPGGSTINGMTAQEYADMLDKKAEEGTDQPFYHQQPGASMGGYSGDLPTTMIEDMDAPPPQPGGYFAQQGQQNPGGAPNPNPMPRQYSENSYGNTSYMTASPDGRNIHDRARAAEFKPKENVLLGTIGAILGAVLGAVVWALIAWAGYISWLGAIVIVACTVFGYILFAKNCGLLGAVIICGLIIGSVYCGNRLGFAISLNRAVVKEMDKQGLTEEDVDVPSIKEIFLNVDDYLSLDGEMKSAYKEDMTTSYIITAVGAVFFLIKVAKK